MGVDLLPDGYERPRVETGPPAYAPDAYPLVRDAPGERNARPRDELPRL